MYVVFLLLTTKVSTLDLTPLPQINVRDIDSNDVVICWSYWSYLLQHNDVVDIPMTEYQLFQQVIFLEGLMTMPLALDLSEIWKQEKCLLNSIVYMIASSKQLDHDDVPVPPTFHEIFKYSRENFYDGDDVKQQRECMLFWHW